MIDDRLTIVPGMVSNIAIHIWNILTIILDSFSLGVSDLLHFADDPSRQPSILERHCSQMDCSRYEMCLCRSKWKGNVGFTITSIGMRGRCVESYGMSLGHYTLRGHEEEKLSIVAIQICTGRRHQIRAHLKHIGHPTVADGKYMPREQFIRDKEGCERNFSVGPLGRGGKGQPRLGGWFS